jgi:hypothetical protein
LTLSLVSHSVVLVVAIYLHPRADLSYSYKPATIIMTNSISLCNGGDTNNGTITLEQNHPSNEVPVNEEMQRLEQSSGSEELELGPAICVSAKKKKRSTRVGLYLKQSRQHPDMIVLIADIDARGLFGSSALHVGQRVLNINGAPCPTSGAEAAQLIKDCKGKLTIEAIDFDDTPTAVVATPPPPPKPSNAVVGQGVLACCHKANKDTSVGLSLRRSKGIGAVLIVKISDRGLFHESDCGLRVGQQLVSINGIACPKSTSAAVELIKQAEGNLIIEAAEINWGETLSGAYESYDSAECDDSSSIAEQDSQIMVVEARSITDDEYDNEYDDDEDDGHRPHTAAANDELAFMEELERNMVQEMDEIREHVSPTTTNTTNTVGQVRSLAAGGWVDDLAITI